MRRWMRMGIRAFLIVSVCAQYEPVGHLPSPSG
jgi:hypothetical protein